jgi:hypothetical protein
MLVATLGAAANGYQYNVTKIRGRCRERHVGDRAGRSSGGSLS